MQPGSKGFADFDPCLVVVLEYCEKGSLKSYVEDNIVPTKQRLLFALDAARGLEHLHSKKFVHRYELASWQHEGATDWL
jgi:serine/threonine protein kinase